MVQKTETQENELLQAQNVSVSLGGQRIVQDVSFSLLSGQWLMLIGPNGAGKSTLIGALSGAVPFQGRITVCGKDARHYKSRELARRLGVLAQNHAVGYGFTVEEVIRMGLYSQKQRLFSPFQKEETVPFAGAEEKVRQAAEATGLTSLLSHSVLTLSGGEVQRTFLAQLFVQDPQILLLDEPANHLDLVYQKQLFSLVSEWLKQPGRAVLSVVHDLTIARYYGTHALLLTQGKQVSCGPVGQVMTPEALQQVFSLDVFDWMKTMYGQWMEK